MWIKLKNMLSTNVLDAFFSVFYYIISSLIAVICLLLIWILTAKFLNGPNSAQNSNKKLSKSEAEVKKIKPLRMAKEIEDKLPQDKKLLEKK